MHNIKNELVKVDNNEVSKIPEYKKMIKKINKSLPAIMEDMANFHKSHSQYMNITVDISQLTPIRRIMHVLAEIQKTKRALEEASINHAKAEVELAKKILELETLFDPNDRELKELEIFEMQLHKKNGIDAMQGAIRKLSAFITQYHSLLEFIGKENITEEEYEKEEDKYHIMTAMKQALCAARARGGLIDEGNHIYLFDIGINGAEAQREILWLLNKEQQLIKDNIEPSFDIVLEWLNRVSEKFAGCGKRKTEKFGFTFIDQDSLINPHK